jgi:hypothetical protein
MPRAEKRGAKKKKKKVIRGGAGLPGRRGGEFWQYMPGQRKIRPEKKQP